MATVTIIKSDKDRGGQKMMDGGEIEIGKERKTKKERTFTAGRINYLTLSELWRVVIDISQGDFNLSGTRQTAHVSTHVLGLDDDIIFLPGLPVHVGKSCSNDSYRHTYRHRSKLSKMSSRPFICALGSQVSQNLISFTEPLMLLIIDFSSTFVKFIPSKQIDFMQKLNSDV